MRAADRPSRLVGPATLATAALATVPAMGTDLSMGMGSPETITYVSVDRLEAQLRDADDVLIWDAEAWIGGDLNKLWFKTEGEDVDDEGLEQAELQLLYSRAIAAFWDVQAGLRHDLRPNPSKTYAVIGLQGLAPYRFEVDAAAFLSEDGDASASVELEYDLRLTQRWILQPRAELDIAFSQVAELGVGRGPSQLEAGLRLRYEVVPEFAPYVGLGYETALGDTRGLRSDEGEQRSDWGLVLGLKAWF